MRVILYILNLRKILLTNYFIFIFFIVNFSMIAACIQRKSLFQHLRNCDCKFIIALRNSDFVRSDKEPDYPCANRIEQSFYSVQLFLQITELILEQNNVFFSNLEQRLMI